MRKNLKKTLPDEIKSTYGAELKSEFQLPSGINLHVYSNGNIDVDELAIGRTFDAGFKLLESQPESTLKKALIKAQKAASQRGFADRDVYMIVSSDPQTCTNGGGEIIPIPAANTGQVCASASFTISADVQESGKRSPSTFQGPLPIRLSLMIVTASAVNNVSHTYPAGVHFALTPEQALSSNITHEAMHVYLRLTGAPKSSAEEQSLQLIEKDLLSYYGLNPADRPIPIKFDR